MKHLITFIFLLSTVTAFAETKNNLVRFVCQQYNDAAGTELFDRVVIAEQISVEAIKKSLVDTVDGSEMTDYQEGDIYTQQTAFRMRIYNGTSLVSGEKTKKEIIEELLKKPASPDVDGELMDFTGTGYRMDSTFYFNSTNPYNKSLSVNLKENKGRVKTNNGAMRMIEDGPYHCEEPVLITPEQYISS